jgi:hypothetical protein
LARLVGQHDREGVELAVAGLDPGQGTIYLGIRAGGAGGDPVDGLGGARRCGGRGLRLDTAA